MRFLFEIEPRKGTRQSIRIFGERNLYLVVEKVSLGREAKWYVYQPVRKRPPKFLGAKTAGDLIGEIPIIAVVTGGPKRARRWGSKGGYAPAKNRPFHVRMQMGYSGYFDVSSEEEIPDAVMARITDA